MYYCRKCVILQAFRISSEICHQLNEDCIAEMADMGVQYLEGTEWLGLFLYKTRH